MSIWSESRAAALMIQWVETHQLSPKWEFKKFPNGTPFFRLELAGPVEGLLVPKGRQWMFAWQDESAMGRASDHPIADLRTDPGLVYRELLHAITSHAELLITRPQLSDAAIVGAYSFGHFALTAAQEANDPLVVARTARVLASCDVAVREFDEAANLIQLASVAAMATGDAALIEEIKAWRVDFEAVVSTKSTEEVPIVSDEDGENQPEFTRTEIVRIGIFFNELVNETVGGLREVGIPMTSELVETGRDSVPYVRITVADGFSFSYEVKETGRLDLRTTLRGVEHVLDLEMTPPIEHESIALLLCWVYIELVSRLERLKPVPAETKAAIAAREFIETGDWESENARNLALALRQRLTEAAL